MGLIFVILAIAVSIWAFSQLFSPPKKHKDFSLKDQKEAMHRALGGGKFPDETDVIPADEKK